MAWRKKTMSLRVGVIRVTMKKQQRLVGWPRVLLQPSAKGSRETAATQTEKKARQKERKQREKVARARSKGGCQRGDARHVQMRAPAAVAPAAAAAVASVAVEGPASALRHKLDGRAVCVEDHRRSNVLALSVLAKAAVSGLYGFPKSLGKACELALRAAMMGDASSQFLLGVVAAEGALGTGDKSATYAFA